MRALSRVTLGLVAALLVFRAAVGTWPFASTEHELSFCGARYVPAGTAALTRAQVLALEPGRERLGRTAFGLLPREVWGDPAIYADEMRDGICQNEIHVRFGDRYREYRLTS